MLSRLGFLFTFRGRVRRLAYLGWWLAAATATVLLILPAVFLGPGAPTPLTWLGRGLAVVGILGLLVASFALTVRRLHDMNLSGWHLLWITVLGLAPSIIGREPENPASLWLVAVNLANIGVMLWLSLMPGTKAPNRFGPPHAASAT